MRDAERKAAYMRQWWKDHPDYKRAYRAAHRGPSTPIKLAYQKRYRAANLERINAGQRQRHHSEEFRAYNRRYINAYRRIHPEVMTTYKAQRRARVVQAEGSHTTAEWLALCEAYQGRCAYCGSSPARLSRDHWVPLSRGGSNDISNIRPSCISCNLRKHDKLPEEFVCQVA